ncbi:MAG: shikimate dehydrogenase [Oscillospiraceae bacterium]|nr:shikimate dehydrogenase [Oscillospiraceae bacterium]
MNNKYTLIGHPLGHSMSPMIHDGLFKIKGKNATYDLTDIAPENLKDNKDFLRSLSGFNITIPHKVAVIDLIDEMSESAKRYNSVNCVANTNGKLIGYNTDCDGFLLSVKANNMPIDKNVLLIGCGGVGRMMAIETVLHNGNLTIAYIPEALEMAENLRKEILQNVSPDACVNTVPMDKISGSFDMLINSSPVGMYPKSDNCPISDEIINNCGCAFDAIYNPVETLLVKKFREQGKIAVGGTAMLVYQAVKAHEIWNNDFYTNDEVNSIIKEVENKIISDFK